jgi:hypothetical protein
MDKNAILKSERERVSCCTKSSKSKAKISIIYIIIILEKILRNAE